MNWTFSPSTPNMNVRTPGLVGLSPAGADSAAAVRLLVGTIIERSTLLTPRQTRQGGDGVETFRLSQVIQVIPGYSDCVELHAKLVLWVQARRTWPWLSLISVRQSRFSSWLAKRAASRPTPQAYLQVNPSQATGAKRKPRLADSPTRLRPPARRSAGIHGKGIAAG